MLTNNKDLASELSFLAFIFFSLGVIFELYFSYINVFHWAPSNYFFILAMVTSFLDKDFLKQAFSRKFLPYFLFFVILGCYTLAFDIFLRDFISIRFIAKPILKFTPILISSAYVFSRFPETKIFRIFIYTSLISCIIAILQGSGYSFFWGLRDMILKAPPILTGGYTRASGMAFYYLTLSEQIIISLPMCFYMYLKTNKRRYLLFQYIMMLALMFTLTRSALVSIFIIYFVWLIFNNKNRKITMINMLILLTITLLFFIFKKYFILIMVYCFTGNFYYSSIIKLRILHYGTSADSRIYMLIMGYKVLMQHFFFGLGSLTCKYKDIISKLNVTSIPEIKGLNAALHNFSHNYFLNFLITYGAFGGIYFFFFLFKLSKTLINKISELKSVLFISVIIGICANSLLHNAGLLNSSTPIFIVGASLSFLFVTNHRTKPIK